MERHGYTVDDLFAHRFTPAFREVMREIVAKARELFLEGLPLVGMVDRRLALDLDLFSRGGMRVLDKIERQDYNVLAARPAISKVERVGLLLGLAGPPGVLAGGMMNAIDRSYEYCRRVARTPRQEFLLLVRAAFAPAAQRHVRHLRLHALLRRSERRARRQPRGHRAMARGDGRGARGPLQRPSGVAGLSSHRPPLRHSARVLPRDDRWRGFRPGAAPLRDFRRALPLLLPGGVGGGPDHHPHLRLRYAAAPCRWPRNAASRSSSPTSCAISARMPNAAASICRPKICAASASPRRTCAPAGAATGVPAT